MIAVFVKNVIHELFIAPRGIIVYIGNSPSECHIIRVNVDQGHSTTSRNPIEFTLPDINASFFQKHEQGKILGKGVGEFNVVSML